MWIKAVDKLENNPNLLKSDGWLIIQIDPIEYIKYETSNFEEFDQRKYGSTLLIFLKPTNS